MISKGRRYLLSRPRKFGKSLTTVNAGDNVQGASRTVQKAQGRTMAAYATECSQTCLLRYKKCRGSSGAYDKPILDNLTNFACAAVILYNAEEL